MSEPRLGDNHMDTSNSPWTFDNESAPLNTSGPLLTLVDGRSFSLSSVCGDISGADPQGFFYLDTRILKKFQLLLNGQPIEPLGHDVIDSFSAQFVGRFHGAKRVADAPIVVFRSRVISGGMSETVMIHNFGDSPMQLVLSAQFETDFAGLFEVKEGRAETGRVVRPTQLRDRLRFSTGSSETLEVEITSDPKPTQLSGSSMSWTIDLEPGDVWQNIISVAALLGGKPVTASTDTMPVSASQRLSDWKSKAPEIATNYAALSVCGHKAISDVGSLRIFDSRYEDQPVVAAGAPWFMTLFGRDSLLTAWMALLVDPDLAVGVLKTLARLQGTNVDPTTEEEPGRILHEVRFSGADSDSFDDGDVYYGTADATPLFVMLVAELNRWTPNKELVQELLPHVDRALDWIATYGDKDGDGFVEYERSTTTGLENQGWKDSWDGIRYRDGTVCRAPIALSEVQAYTYGAYLARADLASYLGETDEAQVWTEKADELKKAFNQQFWLEDLGWFAVGLDSDKNPIDSLASNVGHCLWTGIVDDDKAPIVAENLLSPRMFSGWGLRTLSSANPGYNPTGYHTGSVWPHDTAIAAAGLTKYGLIDQAHRLLIAMLDCGYVSNGRLPELMSGFDRLEVGSPIGYPSSCSPQAWAAAAPLLALRSFLRLEPACHAGTVSIDPVLPAEVLYLNIEGVRIGPGHVSIRVDGGQYELIGLPPEYKLS